MQCQTLNGLEAALVHSAHHEDAWKNGSVVPQVLNLALE